MNAFERAMKAIEKLMRRGKPAKRNIRERKPEKDRARCSTR